MLKKGQPVSKPIEKLESPSKRDFLKKSGFVLLGAFTGLATGAFASKKLYGQQQEIKKLDVVMTRDGWITVYNYPYRDGGVMPSGTEQNLEILEKLGAKGGEKVDDVRRVAKQDRDVTRIKTYVKFEGVEKLLVLVDRGGYFELAVAPASEWPKDVSKN